MEIMCGLKITHNKIISQVDDVFKDIGDKVYNCHILNVPNYLFPSIHKKSYNLSLMVVDMYTNVDRFNPIGTQLYSLGKSCSSVIHDQICGTVYVVCENNNEFVPFSNKNLNDVISGLHQITKLMRTNYEANLSNHIHSIFKNI